jgi:hypothetical protein
VEGKTEVTEDGVALPVVGSSVFGAEVSRSVFGPVRDSGDEIPGPGVLVGSGGNADVATTGLLTLSVVTAGFEADLDGTDMFNPAVARFSVALLPGWDIWVFADTLGIVGVGIFLAERGIEGVFGIIDFAGTGVVAVLPLPLSSAGKSSD